jgi:hypothetical protein
MTDRLERSSDATEVPRRIALIRREAPARLLEDRQEQVTTAPHLLVREIVLIEICVAVLAVISLLFNAPLEGIADPLHTPNPAKAPWYFLGLQELLHYFPPVVAGVLLPTLVVVALVVIPYFRVNVEVRGLFDESSRRRLVWVSLTVLALSLFLVAFHVWPVLIPTLILYLVLLAAALPIVPAGWRRPLRQLSLADWIMVWFVTVSVVLILIGVFFRGPGWSWVWPWASGVQ